MPDGSEHYFNVSLHVLHITAMAINYTTTTGDIAGAMAVISSSVQSLLVSLSSYPSLQTSGSIIGNCFSIFLLYQGTMIQGYGPSCDRDWKAIIISSMDEHLQLRSSKTFAEHFKCIDSNKLTNIYLFLLEGMLTLKLAL